MPSDSIHYQEEDFEPLEVQTGKDLGNLVPAKGLGTWRAKGLSPKNVLLLRATTVTGETVTGMYTVITVAEDDDSDDYRLLRPIHKSVAVPILEKWKAEWTDKEKETRKVLGAYAPPDGPIKPNSLVGWVDLKGSGTKVRSALVPRETQPRKFKDDRNQKNNKHAHDDDGGDSDARPSKQSKADPSANELLGPAPVFNSDDYDFAKSMLRVCKFYVAHHKTVRPTDE